MRALLPLLALWLAAAPLAAQSSGTVLGVVVAAESGEGLPHGIVSIPALGIERFAGARGTFALRDVPAGTHRLRVRRIGYEPRELTVTVGGGATDTLRVALTRAAVRLDAIRVAAKAECVAPGAPSAERDPMLAAAVAQLRMNAEQYRLLVRAHPFTYAMRDRALEELNSGERRVAPEDTVLVRSEPRWTYSPGNVVVLAREPDSSRVYKFMLPTLADLADEKFIGSHCFHAGGMEVVGDFGDTALLRIDVVAASRIRDPDVHGSIYLDPGTFQIRRTVLRLSRMPRFPRYLKEMVVTTDFREILPSVPVIASVVARTEYERGRRWDVLVSLTEQRLVAFEFTGARPGADARPR